MKNRKLKIFLLGMLSFALIFSGFSSGDFRKAYAGGVTSAITISDKTPKAGDTVKVKLTYSGAEFGMAEASLSYNPDVLSFKKADGADGAYAEAYGDDGLLKVKVNGDFVSRMTAVLVFEVTGGGDCEISVKTLNLEDSDFMNLSIPKNAGAVLSAAGGNGGGDGQGSGDGAVSGDDLTADSDSENGSSDAENAENDDVDQVTGPSDSEKQEVPVAAIVLSVVVIGGVLIVAFKKKKH